ncbi:MAG: peptidoglycan DD-metalloendopeptidase family protein [Anaerolineae bacterium]
MRRMTSSGLVVIIVLLLALLQPLAPLGAPASDVGPVVCQTSSGARRPASDSGVSDFTVFVPVVFGGNEPDALLRTLAAIMARFTAQQGYNPSIRQLVVDGDWALAVIQLGVSMPEQSPQSDSVFALAHRTDATWEALMQGDPGWNEWVTEAPSSVMHQSLRELLLDQQATATGIVLNASLPQLRLPWRPSDNPRRISGNLYYENSHARYRPDNFAQDWGLVYNTVVAAAAGRVVDLVCNLPDVRDDSKGYGNYVLMDIGGGYYALYAHLSRCLVYKGQYYQQGAPIGVSGKSGFSTGPHLHFRLRDRSYNPTKPEPISGYTNIRRGVDYYSDNSGSGGTDLCEPTGNQVALYVDAGYRGQCVRLGVGEYPNPRAVGLPNDSISSVKVGSEVQALLCKHDNFIECESFQSSDDNLTDNSIGNDQVSSVRVQLRGGALQVVRALTLSTTNPAVGEYVLASFTVRNVGRQSLVVEQLTSGGRRGADWNGEWADFPSVHNLVLAAGQEYHYQQTRSFNTEGHYFAEPVVKISGNWGGISGANRVQFTVSWGGRLQVVEPLTLSSTSPAVGESVRARFRVKNVGMRALVIEQLTAGGRRGVDWNGDWADFPHVTNVRLEPGQEYTYDQQRSFTTPGGYFAEPVAKINGNWGGISGANRITYTVSEAGRGGASGGLLEVIEQLSLSESSPLAGEVVRARFRVRNAGGTPLAIEQITAGGRRGSTWADEWADFPSVFDITLQPGEEYVYEQERAFLREGAHFAEPVAKLGGQWGPVMGANRVAFTVQAGLRVVEGLNLSPSTPQQNQAVTARFVVQNAGTRSLTVRRLIAAARGPNCVDWDCTWADFPAVAENLVLQPGEIHVYLQQRSFSQAGAGYFAEPLVETPTGWMGMPGGSRVIFTVAEGGRLEIVQPLRLSVTDVLAAEAVAAHFVVRNVGSQTLMIEQLTAGGRRGTSWEGEWADFPSAFNITLRPGQEYTYLQARSFMQEGTYFAEPVARLAGQWGTIAGANRINFAVSSGIQVVLPLTLEPAGPVRGQTVTARFVIRNTGTRPITASRVIAAVRGPNCSDWNCTPADFPVSPQNITLKPGQEYLYIQQRAFEAAGSYFAEPHIETPTGWFLIPNGNHLSFRVD